jgi:hypothetical protein
MTAKLVSVNPEFVSPDSVGNSMTAARAFEVLQPVRMTQSNSYFCFEEPPYQSDRRGWNDFEGMLRYRVLARRRLPALRRGHVIALPSEGNGSRAQRTFAAFPTDGIVTRSNSS